MNRREAAEWLAAAAWALREAEHWLLCGAGVLEAMGLRLAAHDLDEAAYLVGPLRHVPRADWLRGHARLLRRRVRRHHAPDVMRARLFAAAILREIDRLEDACAPS